MAKPVCNLKIPVTFIQEGEFIIAYTPAFDLSTHGKTLEEAKKNFHEAVGLWIEECTKMGTLEQALLELGWIKEKAHDGAHLKPPHVIQTSEELVSLPA